MNHYSKSSIDPWVHYSFSFSYVYIFVSTVSYIKYYTLNYFNWNWQLRFILVFWKRDTYIHNIYIKNFNGENPHWRCSNTNIQKQLFSQEWKLEFSSKIRKMLRYHMELTNRGSHGEEPSNLSTLIKIIDKQVRTETWFSFFYDGHIPILSFSPFFSFS